MTKNERKLLVGITISLDRLLLHINTLINGNNFNEEQITGHMRDTVEYFNLSANLVNELVTLNKKKLDNDFKQLKKKK